MKLSQARDFWLSHNEEMSQFDLSQQTYRSPEFEAIVQDAIAFFEQTPIHPVPPTERFPGAGIYAIYCTARSGIYAAFRNLNSPLPRIPIYTGKAVPKGWRQGRASLSVSSKRYELYNRLREHGLSLQAGAGLEVQDFSCRFLILEGRESDLIGTLEAAIIRKYQPLWNTSIDGFGNHDPGRGRYQEAKSDWDVCHPGRSWAEKCQGTPSDRADLYQRIEVFLQNIERPNE